MTSILLIDDEEIIRTPLREMLEEKEYKVYEAYNGRIGLDICEKNTIDIVITDIVMPDLAGLATIVTLQENYPKTKIIAISGGGGSMEVKDYLHSAEHFGALRTFSKPVQTQQLLSAIQEMAESPA